MSPFPKMDEVEGKGDGIAIGPGTPSVLCTLQYHGRELRG